jgi:hypothetical protein
VRGRFRKSTMSHVRLKQFENEAPPVLSMLLIVKMRLLKSPASSEKMDSDDDIPYVCSVLMMYKAKHFY